MFEGTIHENCPYFEPPTEKQLEEQRTKAVFPLRNKHVNLHMGFTPHHVSDDIYCEVNYTANNDLYFKLSFLENKEEKREMQYFKPYIDKVTGHSFRILKTHARYGYYRCRHKNCRIQLAARVEGYECQGATKAVHGHEGTNIESSIHTCNHDANLAFRKFVQYNPPVSISDLINYPTIGNFNGRENYWYKAQTDKKKQSLQKRMPIPETSEVKPSSIVNSKVNVNRELSFTTEPQPCTSSPKVVDLNYPQMQFDDTLSPNETAVGSSKKDFSPRQWDMILFEFEKMDYNFGEIIRRLKSGNRQEITRPMLKRTLNDLSPRKISEKIGRTVPHSSVLSRDNTQLTFDSTYLESDSEIIADYDN
ncbi:hypothetical protein Ciccas_002079 [Cichlidogyrus casuarinus]|uniref:FLYWCH-type domain-containing protein n=1 Tax=Cichlidogyrus casuarinus TaxID=1844966 RepID=A0ABD2QI88_9PLAT